jgi:hypothetical protein
VYSPQVLRKKEKSFWLWHDKCII